MSRRDAAREETRRRIVEATYRLHGERGVFGTTYKDIAAAADVSVATVYSHFPKVEDLLPACGALVMERAQPPRSEDAAAIAGDSGAVEVRLRRVAEELFGYYERGGRHLELDARERELPEMRAWQESERAMVEAFARAALKGSGARAGQVARVSALLDQPTFGAMRARGIGVADAALTAARAGAALLANK